MVVVFLYSSLGDNVVVEFLYDSLRDNVEVVFLHIFTTAFETMWWWYSYIYVRQLSRQCGGGILIRQLVRQSGGGIHTPQLVRPRAAKLPRKLRLGSQNITTVIKLSFRSFLFCEQYC